MLLSPGVRANDASECAASIHELLILVGDPLFPRRWEEISMGDGKPLMVSIVQRNGGLLLEFIKTGEGMWAEVAGVICRSGPDLKLRTTKEQIGLGSAANWMLRLALANGGVFTLQRPAANQLRIATHGWNGRFVPAALE
jgi:hypothetical protein